MKFVNKTWSLNILVLQEKYGRFHRVRSPLLNCKRPWLNKMGMELPVMLSCLTYFHRFDILKQLKLLPTIGTIMLFSHFQKRVENRKMFVRSHSKSFFYCQSGKNTIDEFEEHFSPDQSPSGEHWNAFFQNLDLHPVIYDLCFRKVFHITILTKAKSSGSLNSIIAL